jgi:small subunit ribosomal protein S6
MGKRRLAYEVDRHREGFYVLFAIGANGDIVRECERRLRVMDPVIKYLTVRLDDEARRFEKLRNYRLKRAARRGSNSPVAAPPEQFMEESM